MYAESKRCLLPLPYKTRPGPNKLVQLLERRQDGPDSPRGQEKSCQNPNVEPGKPDDTTGGCKVKKRGGGRWREHVN